MSTASVKPKRAAKKSVAAKPLQFSENDIIADVIAAFPPAIPIMTGFGLHCVGCSANTADSIGAGASSHGLDEDVIKDIVKALNEQALVYSASILEANGLRMTPTAQTKILEIAREEGKTGVPLRVEVQGGGCAGFTYVLDFDAATPADTVYAFPEVTLVATAEHTEKFKGSLVDFLDGPMGTGFKIDNPNPTGCVCGTHDGHRA